jgi:hypothetical protein
MRIFIAAVLFLASLTRLSACSCIGPGTPCLSAGSASAVFTGKVLGINNPPSPLPIGNPGPATSARRTLSDPAFPMQRMLRVVRFQVADILTGVDSKQKEIEVATGQGGGDCGYPFQVGTDYVVYARKNAEGQLETGICHRTRPLTEAAEDLEYFRTMSNAPDTSQIRVRTGLPNSPGKPGAAIIADFGGTRSRALTNAAGEALFTGMTPGDYTIHAESDGDLPDDPKVEVHPKGCLDLTLFRILHITGRILTRGGLPAARIEVELRSIADKPADGSMTDADGRYAIRVVTPGQYFLGINLNHTPTRDTPYPRWFYPGTQDSASAAGIDFAGKPETRTYDLTLPDRQPERTIDGIVLRADGQAMPRAVVTVYDFSKLSVAQAFADQEGRFTLSVFSGVPYRLYAVWPGRAPGEAASAVPLDIPPDSSPLNLRLILTQPGNVFLEELRQAPGIRR